ncbi:MAG: rhodanese-like domain-containing protein [Methanomassiliicoccales archaeon]|jgi:hydroxyacylglutathione hydrolase
MFVAKVKSEGLAHISYFVGSGTEACVIDPRRDCDEYLRIAEEKEMRIRFIFETHRNEDYATGSIELASMTGAEIFHGGAIPFNYGRNLHDGQEFLLGDVRIRAIATPGHTYEHFCYSLIDLTTGDEPVMVFTGDALFAGDVGRTDLPGEEHREELSGSLYDSLFDKIIPLGMGVIVYPGHGAGSVCGGNISDREETTIGIELENNPMLSLTREEFVAKKMKENIERPPYFRKMEEINLSGPPLLGRLPVPRPLPVHDFRSAMKGNMTVLDVRMPYSFGGAHIDGSLSIWLEGLSQYGGYYLDYERPLLLVVENRSQVQEAVRSLVRIGYDDIPGYLRVGMDMWCRAGAPVTMTHLTTPSQVKEWIDSGKDITLVDVRNMHELRSGVIANSKIIHIGSVEARLQEIPRNKPVVIYCSSGYRGGMGAGLLLKNCYTDVWNMLGGTNAWKALGYPMVVPAQD